MNEQLDRAFGLFDWAVTQTIEGLALAVEALRGIQRVYRSTEDPEKKLYLIHRVSFLLEEITRLLGNATLHPDNPASR